MHLALEVILWTGAAFWMAVLFIVFSFARYKLSLKPLPEGAGENPTKWPLVSILVPARNEEHRVLREAITLMLGQDYPELEVIAVNDRSTDGTQRILEEIAATDARLRVIRGQEPPTGWLGKPYALHQAAAAARGEWLLAVDADVLLHRASLRTALAGAQRYECDVLSLLPKMDYVSFWDHVIEPQALNLLRLSMLLGSAKASAERKRERKPRRREAGGSRVQKRESRRSFDLFHSLSSYLGDQAFTIGAFTLMRREALDGVGGYASIKDQVMDETILGIRLKESGYRVFAAEGPHLIHTPARGAFSELWAAYSRVLYPVLGRNPIHLIVGIVGATILTIMPVAVVILSSVSLLTGATSGLQGLMIPALLAYGSMVAVGMKLSEEDHQPWAYHLLSFIGYAVFIAIAVASMWRAVNHRGVHWKGRYVYSGGKVARP